MSSITLPRLLARARQWIKAGDYTPRLPSLLGWLATLATLGLLVVQRYIWFGENVPGLDGGSWFAYGRQLFGLPGGKPEPGTFPLLVPSLLHLGQLVAGPMLAAKLVGLSSVVAIMIATYVVTSQGIISWLALPAAVSVAVSGSVMETMIFGGYPQNFALAFLMPAALTAVLYMNHGTRRELGLAAAAWSAVGLTHHMYFAVTSFAIGIAWIIWIVATRPSRVVVIHRTLGIALVGAFALSCAAPTLFRLYRADYSPPVNASQTDLLTALQYTVREAPWIWAPVFSMGICYIGLRRLRALPPAGHVALSLMISSLILFPITAEPRLLPPFFAGACIAFGDTLQIFWKQTRTPLLRTAIAVTAIAVPTSLWSASSAVAPQWYDFYQVVNTPLLNAADYIDTHRRDGVVVVQEDRRGWAVGWWFEGLTGASIVTGADERWLAFPAEVKNARLAQRLFDQQLTYQQVMSLAAENDVDFLVFRKWEWIGWMTWIEEPEFNGRVAYDDDEMMIFDLQKRFLDPGSGSKG